MRVPSKNLKSLSFHDQDKPRRRFTDMYTYKYTEGKNSIPVGSLAQAPRLSSGEPEAARFFRLQADLEP